MEEPENWWWMIPAQKDKLLRQNIFLNFIYSIHHFTTKSLAYHMDKIFHIILLKEANDNFR